MIFTLTDEMSQVVLTNIRRYFSDTPETQPYRWSPDDSQSKIWIEEDSPEARHRLPSIIVRGVVGTTQELSLNQAGGELLDEDGNNVGEKLVGFYNPNIDLVVEADKDSDCKQIADLLVMGMLRGIRIGIVRDTEGNAYPVPPYVRVTGRSRRPLTDKTSVHTITLSQTWNVTWYDEVIYPDTLQTVAHTATLTES